MNVYFKLLARIVCLWGCVSGGIAVEAVSPKMADAFFQDTKVWDVALTVSPENYAALEPAGGRGFDVDFKYVRAGVRIAGQAFKDAGLRYKGNSSFSTARGIPKKSFKIDFNEYDDDLEFRGLTKVNLNNNSTDPSLMREPLSYELFREAEIHCSRVGYAKVSLTIPGKIDRQPHGLYTVVEQVDKRFLKDRYGSAKGLLMKPSTFGAFRYFGEKWDEYEIGFVPKTKPSEEQKQRVIEFAKLIHKSGDDAFEEKVESYLDVDQFLRFLAVNVLLTNLDSFLGGSQNHYIYLEPDSNKFQFFPWDVFCLVINNKAHSKEI